MKQRDSFLAACQLTVKPLIRPSATFSPDLGGEGTGFALLEKDAC